MFSQSQPPRHVQLASSTETEAWLKTRVLHAVNQAPLSFELNQGQSPSDVKFLAKAGGYAVFLRATDAILTAFVNPETGGSSDRRTDSTSRPPASVRLRFLRANQNAQIRGDGKLPGTTSYLIGDDASKWLTGVPSYEKAIYEDLYPGINLVFYGNQRQLQYDLVVSPGADHTRIGLEFAGAERVRLDLDGNLILFLKNGTFRQLKPSVYQDREGKRETIACRYVIQGRNKVGLALGEHDRTAPFVIDPIVDLYSTYLGGEGNDIAHGVAIDAAGNAYVTGSTYSYRLPPVYGPWHIPYLKDVFVAKFSPPYDTPGPRGPWQWTAYIGGTGNDEGKGIDVSHPENVGTGCDPLITVTGTTWSPNFPHPLGFQTALAGGSDAFVARLDPANGLLLSATYLGGPGNDTGEDVATFWQRNDYVFPEGGGPGLMTFVVGGASTGFPTLPNLPNPDPPMFPRVAFQLDNQGGKDGFLSVFQPYASNVLNLKYSTFIGGSAEDYLTSVSVDPTTRAATWLGWALPVYMAGCSKSTDLPARTPPNAGCDPLQPDHGTGVEHDAFVAMLDPLENGDEDLQYLTYLGGSGADEAHGIALDSALNAHVTGFTESAAGDFALADAFQPVRRGPRDAFVSKIDPNGCHLLYSTFFGGDGTETGLSIAVDSGGFAVVVGNTDSQASFPFVPWPGPPAAGEDVFTAAFSPAGRPVYSTIRGGSGTDQAGMNNSVALDIKDAVFIVGATDSQQAGELYPTTPNALPRGQYQDALFSVIDPFEGAPDPCTYPTNCAYSCYDDGSGSKYFCPNEPLTRAQLAYFILKAYESANSFVFPVPPDQQYVDVPPNHPFFLWTQKTAPSQYMEACDSVAGAPCGPGTDAKLFCPDRLATRAEFFRAMVLLYQPAVNSGVCEKAFCDMDPTANLNPPWSTCQLAEALLNAGAPLSCMESSLARNRFSDILDYSRPMRWACPDEPVTRETVAFFTIALLQNPPTASLPCTFQDVFPEGCLVPKAYAKLLSPVPAIGTVNSDLSAYYKGCFDGKKGGTEQGIDCGGICPKTCLLQRIGPGIALGEDYGQGVWKHDNSKQRSNGRHLRDDTGIDVTHVYLPAERIFQTAASEPPNPVGPFSYEDCTLGNPTNSHFVEKASVANIQNTLGTDDLLFAWPMWTAPDLCATTTIAGTVNEALREGRFAAFDLSEEGYFDDRAPDPYFRAWRPLSWYPYSVWDDVSSSWDCQEAYTCPNFAHNWRDYAFNVADAIWTHAAGNEWPRAIQQGRIIFNCHNEPDNKCRYSVNYCGAGSEWPDKLALATEGCVQGIRDFFDGKQVDGKPVVPTIWAGGVGVNNGPAIDDDNCVIKYLDLLDEDGTLAYIDAFAFHYGFQRLEYHNVRQHLDGLKNGRHVKLLNTEYFHNDFANFNPVSSIAVSSRVAKVRQYVKEWMLQAREKVGAIFFYGLIGNKLYDAESVINLTRSIRDPPGNDPSYICWPGAVTMDPPHHEESGEHVALMEVQQALRAGVDYKTDEPEPLNADPAENDIPFCGALYEVHDPDYAPYLNALVNVRCSTGSSLSKQSYLLVLNDSSDPHAIGLRLSGCFPNGPVEGLILNNTYNSPTEELSFSWGPVSYNDSDGMISPGASVLFSWDGGEECLSRR